VIDLGIEGLGSRVVGEAQDVAAPDAGQPAGARDEQEAHGAHAPDQVRIGAFAGAGFRGGQGVELEAADEVVSEDTELLPGTVGAVVARGDDVEGELPLEFGDGLFLGAAATDEGVQGRQGEREVRGDGAVLEVAIIGGEQIELEVPGTRVLDVLAVDHDPELQVPLRNVQVVEEPRDVRRDREPALPRGGQLLEGQPAPVADLDGVGTAPGGQEAQDVALEESRVHAELEREATTEGRAQAGDDLPQEGPGLLRIVHIAGPILDPQDVARLGEMGQERVVAGILAVMGIEAAEGSTHGGPRADHGAIKVDRQPWQGQALDGVDDEGLVELDERAQGGLGELAQPVADGAGGGDPRQPAEAREQRIPRDIAQVLQPPSADVEQAEHEQREASSAIVAARRATRRAQPLRHVPLLQIAPEQLQATVRGQLLLDELDVQLPLDQPSQARYAQSHQRGLLCVGSNIGVFSLKTTQGAFLIQRHRPFTHHLFSDWGPGVSTSRSDKARIDGKCHNLSVTRRSVFAESCRALRARGAGDVARDGEGHGNGWSER